MQPPRTRRKPTANQRSLVAPTIPEQDFQQLFSLIRTVQWLEPKMDPLLSLWNLCDDVHQRELLQALFAKFTYVDSHGLHEGTNGMVLHFLNKWEIDAKTTLIVATAGGTDADGSQMLLQLLKSSFPTSGGWEESCFVSTIGQGLHRAKDHGMVILLDDFIGTGKTAKRKSEWFLNKLKERGVTCTVRFAALAAMMAAKTTLDQLSIEYYSFHWLPKGISDNFTGDHLTAHMEAMKGLEKKLGKVWKGKKLNDYHLGFGRSEALFAIESGNVPNNVFPVFWWPKLRPDAERRTILRRLAP